MATSKDRRLATVIVDDEAPARRRLRFMLGGHPDIDVVGEFAAADAARRALPEVRPDLLFLDVQLPAGDGFSLIEGTAPDSRPVVVFVTAHERYAARAYAVDAVDYLLKPFSEERFDEALWRARRAIEYKAARHGAEKIGSPPVVAASAGQPAGRLAVRAAGRVTLLPQREVEWIDAAHNRARVHSRRGVHLLQEPLGHLERRLDPRLFLRVHRSTVVNVLAVQEVVVTPAGQYLLAMPNGQRLPVSRPYRRQVRAWWRGERDAGSRRPG